MNKKSIRIFSISFITFLLITIVFNRVIPVFAVSGVRPSAALNPVLGLAFGWPAALGCAAANFLSDLISGYGIGVALLGALPQILYGILPYYGWNLVVSNTSMRTRLDTPYKVIDYVLLMAVNSVIIGIAVGGIQVYAAGSGFWDTVKFAALNDFVVCLVFGLPLMVLLDYLYSRYRHGGRRKLSDNERIILYSSLCQLLAFVVITIVIYSTLKDKTNLEKWSRIYSSSTAANGIIIVLSVIAMHYNHRYVKKHAGLDIITKTHGTVYIDTKKSLEFTSFPGELPDKRIKADFLGYLGRTAEKESDYEKAWYVQLSNQRGCPMNCAFCDCPSVGYHGDVSVEDFAYQIETILDTHYVSSTKYFEVDFMRMGEPSLNKEILDFIEYNLRDIIHKKIDAEVIMPCLCTMLPANKHNTEKFVLEYCRIKNEVYDGNAQLVFSIHTTSDSDRNKLLANRSLQLAQISEIADKMPEPKGLKYALSFAVGTGAEIDVNKIDKLFDKNKFLIRLMPVHTTYSAVDNGFTTMVGYKDSSPISRLEKEFIRAGWEVMIFEDSVEEDKEDLTYGKLMLPSIMHDTRKTDKKRKCYGIIAALQYEEDLFRAELSNVKKVTLLNKQAYTGIIGDNEVVIMQCGMGKVSAGICAQTLIDTYHPDYIINTGCAGALDPTLKVGDIVVSDSVVEWDLDLREIGLPLGYVDALGCVEMKASKELADKIMNARPENIYALRGTIASGDQFVSRNEQRKTITDNFPGALCAEMEGAAVGHVCLQNDTPFCVIRAMSDTADGNSGTDFASFSEQASRVSAAWLIKMLKNNK